MKVGSVIRFHDDLFFDGAVQLSWLQKRPDQADRAASAFVFHGPRYHGVDRDTNELGQGYRLKDTASFINNLLDSLVAGSEGKDANPYWLVVAGYGSGKSHLALTSASLLSHPESNIASHILDQVARADQEIADSVTAKLKTLGKPVLVLPLDGMANFHLGNALSRSAFKQLQLHGLNAQAILDLSPRFQIAEQFVQRNYSIREDQFSEKLPKLSSSQICNKLQEHNESIYAEVDAIYAEANGRPIPVEGMESAQDLLDTLCRVYCGTDGPFSHVLILFDEFGRYLEYAADKPNLAGDSALQQIFQGVQDNNTKVRFIGFIQYELKAYLKRFGGADLRQLQRYVTRFDTSDKFYLSSNLETIFAHMIGKDEEALSTLWSGFNGNSTAETTWHVMSQSLPGFDQLPLWNNIESFTQVIARGCWPLHPLTVWFLTKLRDVVQSRSALTFIRDIVERSSNLDAVSGIRLRYISVAQLVLQNMLPELISAEREAGGTTAETLQFLLTRFQGRLELDEELVLAGVAALGKMRVGKKNKDQADVLLCEATGLPADALLHCITTLSELGALEWNRDLGQYELLSDGTSRAQFQQWIRQQQAAFTSDAIRDFFIRQAVTSLDLSSVASDFSQANEINTPEWHFEANFTNTRLLSNSLESAFDDWEKATSPKDAKGKLLYLYLHPEDSVDETSNIIEAYVVKRLKKMRQHKVPVWIVAIVDHEGLIAEHLSRMHLFSQELSEAEAQKFHRFLPDEQERSQIALRENVQKAIKTRLYWIAGFEQIPSGRLSSIAHTVFKTVYPNVIPFPFDGFATANGGGPPDVAQLIRGFIAHQVSGTWVQAQPKRLQNRVNSVLIESWRAFLSSGKLCVPQHPAVKTLYERIEMAHQSDPERTLYASYAELILPPFGLNSSSAGLLLALVLASETPQRRITLDGSLVSAAEWISLVFKRPNELAREVLERSRLVFLAEDATARWRNHLTSWETELTYEGILRLASEAKVMGKIDPIPEVLEGSYNYLTDKTKDAFNKLHTMESQLSSLELELERAERTVSIPHSIRFGIQLLDISKQVSEIVWPLSFVEQCDDLLNIARTQIGSNVASWIPTQLCKSVAQLSDFRHQTGRQIKGLEQLGFNRESQELSKQVQGSIQRVEQLQKYSLTLAEIEDYPRQPLPTDSTSVRYIRDAITTGTRLIEAIQNTQTVLTASEIQVRRGAIETRQKLLRDALTKKRDALGDIYASPTGESQLREILIRARQLQTIFSDTPDESEISSAILLIERIQSDIESWPSETLSAERLDHILEQQVSAQVARTFSFLNENEIDPPWPIEPVYRSVANERMERSLRQSEEWIQPRLSLVDSISEFDMPQCKALEEELTKVPTFLSSKARDTIKALQETLLMQITMLEERSRKASIDQWMSQFPHLAEIAELGRNESERSLQYANSCPYELNLIEAGQVQEITHALTERIDQLGIEDLFNRIKQLSTERQLELKELLSSLISAREVINRPKE